MVGRAGRLCLPISGEAVKIRGVLADTGVCHCAGLHRLPRLRAAWGPTRETTAASNATSVTPAPRVGP
jgi:hypothetical protein